ncbi:sigma-54-dependent Fis family transcriptional regulator [Nocardia rhamnosiphila]|uniref:Helix-turn-helix domain-containing protein n=1 Tax=Nocardia rhamnosiphila TaxID=426716 RepID=A0ABV2WRD8_9NOCA
MEWTVSSVMEVREEFMATGALPAGTCLPEPIVQSWRRSCAHGLRSDSALPTPGDQMPAREGKLVQAARQVLRARGDALSGYQCAVVVTATDGRVLLRSAADSRFSGYLDQVGVFPGWDVSEKSVGTASLGILLETGHSVLVRGPEHFTQQAQQMSSAAAYIHHPVTKRKIGTISLVAAFVDTSPLMLSWTRDLAASIEDALLAMSSDKKRALFEAYLANTKHGRQPMICLDGQTIIGNSASARLMGGLSQEVLWEFAGKAVQVSKISRQSFDVDGPGTIIAECEPIESGLGSVAGAIIRFERMVESTPVRVERTDRLDKAASLLPGLAGHSVVWRKFCRQVTEAWVSPEPTLLVGEAGTGKTTVIDALTADSPVARCSTAAECADMLDTDVYRTLVVEHVEDLDRHEIDKILRRARACDVKVVGSYTHGAGLGSDQAARAVGAAFRTVYIPPMRDRREDLPDLLKALTADECGRGGPTWHPDVVTALTRIQWPRNVAELKSVVTDVLRTRRDRPDVRMRDLPVDVQLRSTRRPLSRLEESEAVAIIEAMRDADGNKKLAAESLGVARSTLYRKVRALGLDSSAFNF